MSNSDACYSWYSRSRLLGGFATILFDDSVTLRWYQLNLLKCFYGEHEMLLYGTVLCLSHLRVAIVGLLVITWVDQASDVFIDVLRQLLLSLRKFT
jgi:hypothetical protein